MMKDYATCSGFKIMNENEEYYTKFNEPTTAEKDYRQVMMMSTPPSNTQRSSKYLMISTHNGLFSCTPKEDILKPTKDEAAIKP